MKKKQSPVLIVLAGLILLLIAGSAAVLLVTRPWQQSARTAPAAPAAPGASPSPSAPASPAAPGASPSPSAPAEPVDLNAPALQKGEGEGAAWQPAPPCDNDPFSAAEWQSTLERSRGSASAASTLQRAGLLAGSPPAPGEGLLAPEPPAVGEYEALLMNVAVGKLNRATTLSLPDAPEIRTVGDLIDRAGAQTAAPEPDSTISAVLSGEAIESPVCARLVVVQAGGVINPVVWDEGGVQSQPNQAMAAQSSLLAAANPRQANLDFGMASPDGRWAAYTSLGMDSGGPVFLQNLQSGAWTNLIEAANAARAPEQIELNPADWWTVIDWFPDSRRLLIGRTDASSVVAVDLESFAFREYAFLGGGSGGSMVTDLTPDGSGFVFIGQDDTGLQSVSLYRFEDGGTTTLFQLPLESGVLYFPRFSPDGTMLAYLVQQGDPQGGLTYSIHLFSLSNGEGRAVAPGNVGMTVPMWSPDGQYIAYTRGESGQPIVVTEGQAPAQEPVNVWVAQVSSGEQVELTAVEGEARSPVWSTDGSTLAFITGDGSVGMTTLYQPGRMWLAAHTSPQFPLLTSVFFVP